MNQIGTNTPTLAPIPASPARLHRLIVLVPDLDTDYLPAIRRIRELAAARQASILLLGLCDAQWEPGLRRHLITMSAMIQDDQTSVEVYIEVGKNWLTIVKQNYQTGDTIVCFAEQRTGLLRRPLSQILQSNLNLPIYILSGQKLPNPRSDLLLQGMAWLGSFGIIIGFFILQMNIIQVSKGGLQNILLTLSIIPEFWMVLFWNSQFG